MTPGALRWKNAARNKPAGIDHISKARPARMAHDGTLPCGARDCKALMRGLRLRRHGIRLLAARSWSAGRRRNDPQARDESRVAALLVAVRHRSRRASRVDGALDVSVLDDGPAAGRRRPGLPGAAGDDGLARAGDEPDPARHQRARHSVSQPPARCQDAGDDRPALGRPRHPRRGRRLAPRGIRGAGGAALRGARGRDRRVPAPHARGVDDRSRDLRGPLLQRARRARAAEARAAPRRSDLDRRPHRRGRAARGDAWHPIALRPPGLLFPDEYAKRATELRAWAQQAGRDPKSIELTVRVPMEVRPKNAKPPAGERPLFQGTAAEVVADIRAYQAAGVTHFVFDPTVPELKAALTNMERFAHDVRGNVERKRAR